MLYIPLYLISIRIKSRLSLYASMFVSGEPLILHKNVFLCIKHACSSASMRVAPAHYSDNRILYDFGHAVLYSDELMPVET